MEKQVLFAIALSLLVLFAFRYYQEYRTARAPKMRRHAQTAVVPKPAPVSFPAEAVPIETKASGKKIFIEGVLYRATLDNRGALLTGWELRQYKAAGDKTFEMIAAKPDGGSQPYPGTLLLEDPALSALANNECYEVQVMNAPASSGMPAPPITIVMRLVRGDFLIEKRYQFEKDNYLLDFSLTMKKDGKPIAGRILLGQDIGPEQERLHNQSDHLQAVSLRDGKVRREDPPKNENEIKKSEGDLRWVGLDTQYFSIVAIPNQPLAWFDFQKIPAKTVDSEGKEITRDLLRLAIPEYGSAQFKVYLGPKDRANLKAVRGADLTGLINYGMFSFLVTPLLTVLKWINHCIGNYGFSIVILTFFLNTLLFPFRLKQTISMKKMAAIQPKVKAIQEKYSQYKKTDPRRLEMNREVAALYKEHNVSPLGGCLPMILQAPFLCAFGSLLAYSIELRRAPFIGWIRDLSAKDPFYVLPILMGITTFILQQLTPMAPGTDPAQAKMMMIVLPLVLTVMLIYYSAGLNLYFLCSNLFQIGFQKIGERYVRRIACAAQ